MGACSSSTASDAVVKNGSRSNSYPVAAGGATGASNGHRGGRSNEDEGRSTGVDETALSKIIKEQASLTALPVDLLRKVLVEAAESCRVEDFWLQDEGDILPPRLFLMDYQSSSQIKEKKWWKGFKLRNLEKLSGVCPEFREALIPEIQHAVAEDSRPAESMVISVDNKSIDNRQYRLDLLRMEVAQVLEKNRADPAITHLKVYINCPKNYGDLFPHEGDSTGSVPAAEESDLLEVSPEALRLWDELFGALSGLRSLTIETDLNRTYQLQNKAPEFGYNLILESASRLLPHLEALNLNCLQPWVRGHPQQGPHTFSYRELSSSTSSGPEVGKVGHAAAAGEAPHDDHEDDNALVASVYGPTPEIFQLALKRWHHHNGGIRRLDMSGELVSPGGDGLPADDDFYRALYTYAPDLECFGGRGVDDIDEFCYRKMDNTASDDTMLTFFRRCQNLRTWEFDSDELMEDPELLGILAKVSKPKLRSLRISEDTEALPACNYDELYEGVLDNVEHLGAFLSSCPALEEFVVQGEIFGDFVTDKTVKLIRKHCPKFRFLYMMEPDHGQEPVRLHYFGDKGLSELAKMAHLELAYFYSTSQVTGKGLADFIVKSQALRCELVLSLHDWDVMGQHGNIFKLIEEFCLQMAKKTVVHSFRSSKEKDPRGSITLKIRFGLVLIKEDEKLKWKALQKRLVQAFQTLRSALKIAEKKKSGADDEGPEATGSKAEVYMDESFEESSGGVEGSLHIEGSFVFSTDGTYDRTPFALLSWGR